MGDGNVFLYLLRFIVITLVLAAGLWGLRWYIVNKFQPRRPTPLINVVERTFLAPGRQGMVIEVDQQRFFVIMSDKHSSITELKHTANFAETLQEEANNANDNPN